jgi:beta-lactamase regulating signal transducer with metallopeptidase domain
MDVGGYSVTMPWEATETLFSATTVLWIVVSLMAAIFLLGSINRRRSRLTESLRDYVAQKQDRREAVSSPDQPSED